MPTGLAATEEEIEAAIVNGTAWLANAQKGDGSWDGGGGDSDIGATGLALLKFIDYAKEKELNPTDPEYEYRDTVIAGLAYLDNKIQTVSVAGGYDGNSNGNMTYLNASYRTYITGIATMAYAANPDTDEELVQDLTDWLVNAQCTDPNAVQYGVWSYNGFTCSGDNSNTGYATLGLAYANNFGASFPQSTKTALSSYVDYIQNDPGTADDGSEDDPDGGSGYSNPSSWVNSLKTGNLIFEAWLAGDEPDSQRIINATYYLERHWNDDIEGWQGNLSAPIPYNTQSQATYTIMKGFEAIGLEDLDGIDWFDEISTALVNDQQANGSWTMAPNYVGTGGWAFISTNELSTTWALLTLEKVVPNRLPDISEAYPSISCVWPPNHKFVDITVEGVTDPDDDPVTINITGITSDEPTTEAEGEGSKILAPDASGVGTDIASIRAERSGIKDGRVYEIHFIASDGIDEVEGSVFVVVPHDNKDPCPDPVDINDGQYYDATELN